MTREQQTIWRGSGGQDVILFFFFYFLILLKCVYIIFIDVFIVGCAGSLLL